MIFTVTTAVKQVMGDSDGTLTLMVNNGSGFDFFLCSIYTDSPELDGFPVAAGSSMIPFEWTGPLYIGVNQKQTGGQSVGLTIVKSVRERIPIS